MSPPRWSLRLLGACSSKATTFGSGLVAEEALKLHKFQVARLLRPWTPKEMVLEHGGTPDCTACKQITKKGTTSHSRVHNRRCKDRCRKYLQDEQKKFRDSQNDAVKQPVALEKEAGLVPQGRGDIHRKCLQLASKSSPQGAGEGSETVVVPPEVSPIPPPEVSPVPDLSAPHDSMSDGYSQGAPMSVTPDISPDVDMEDMELPPPIPEQMELDVLVNQMLDQNIDRFLGMEHFFAGGDWFESSVCGIDLWQQLPQNAKCESTGVALKTQPLREAIQR